MFTRHSTCAAALSLLAIAVLTTSVATGQRITNNVSEGIHRASDLGRIDPTTEINITVQMKLRDEAAFNKVVDALYDPSSPTFHKWLTDEDLRQYAPSKEQYDAVRKELENHGLIITSVDENSFSIRAHGATENVESAFNTEIHEFQRNGKVFRSNVTNARLAGAAGDYVSSVAGIESHQAHPLYRRALNPRTGQPLAPIALRTVQDSSSGLSSFLTDTILSKATTFTFTTPGADLPVGVYFGNVYGKNPNLTPGFTPAQLQILYGLPAAYQKGWNGAGQTIVLLEAYGYPTIQADANAFFQLTGLPPLTSSNFKIIYPQGQPVSPIAGELTGWNVEIALDVQWAHSIAPGAKIVVVAAAGQDNESLLAAMTYIISNKIGYAVNDSWEIDQDIIAGPLEEEAFDQVLTLAAAKGISFQFSTGDGGDGGLGEPIGAPGVPSNSPHCTAVGGTSLLNKLPGPGYETLGWGSNLVLLNDGGVVDPPEPLPNDFGGAGGGESVYFPKPSWQKGLPGTGRQVPDVSALADPYTGAAIVVTSGQQQFLITGIGGTSLASPIFTAFWAIANQKAGHSLGQAAPTIAGLKSGLIDVLPLSSPTNVAGTIFDSSGATYYSPTNLFAGFLNGTTFTSAVWGAAPGVDLALSFGLDSSLTVTRGWDNVTGYGTPNGVAFLNAVTK
jgi:subtilase family serine protease